MKKGFTLIELLAVIVILAIIALIAVPIVINIIEDAKKSSQEESLRQYGRAIENGVANYLLKHPTVNPDTLTIEDIKDYVKYSGEKIDCEIVQIGDKGEIYLSDCTVGKTKVEYEYGEQLYMIIDLSNGLTPVIYDGDNWKITTSSDKNWYDYDKQKWANAVVLKQNSTKTVGDTVTVEGNDPDVLMMYVWIPRYEYKIEGDYGKGGTSTTNPGEIEINFIGKNITQATAGYIIHPAFTFGDKEESGFWVGKFELSSIGENLTAANNLGCNGTTCTSDITNLRILPNISSLRYNSVSNYFYAIKRIGSSFGLIIMDTHMMKNSEWGAVAYLSQSKYGKYGNKNYEGIQKEIYQNKSSSYITGSSNGTPSQDTTNTQCSYDDVTNNCGIGASTTGNIYGIYDMSGGAWEYVMGVYGTEEGEIYSGYSLSSNSGFNGKTGNDNRTVTDGIEPPDLKYYDIYINTTNVDSNDEILLCKNKNDYGICYGDGISETTSWYGDYAHTVSSEYPWFLRGGYYYLYTTAGIFASSYNHGNSHEHFSSRVVIFKK